MDVKPLQVILHQENCGLVFAQVKAAEHLEFKAFDVDGDKIEPGMAGLGEDIVEGADIDFLDVADLDALVDGEAGQGVLAGDVKAGFAALVGGAESSMDDAAAGALALDEFIFRGDGLDEDSPPAILLEEPGLAANGGMVGAGFDEETVPLAAEMFPEDEVLAELGIRSHARG